MWTGPARNISQLLYLLFGPFWYVYWIFHILLGVVVPVLLLSRSRKPWVIGVASGLVAVTYFAERLDLVIPGLVFPELKGLETAYQSHRLTYYYLPSFFEWQVVVGVVAAGIALFYLGYRFLPLTGRERTT